VATTSFRAQMQLLKKDRIRGEAERLFYERGFSGTSMDAIAESMQATKPFIYGSYASKGDILFDIHLSVVHRVFDAVETARRENALPSEGLRDFARRLTTLVLENQAAVAVFFREEGAITPRQLKRINDLKSNVDDNIAALLDEGVATGEFDVEDTRTAALAIGGMISWSYTWYRDDGRLDAATIAEHMASYAMRIAGLRPATAMRARRKS
jgi:AcrR family transcriptional regulator